MAIDYSGLIAQAQSYPAKLAALPPETLAEKARILGTSIGISLTGVAFKALYQKKFFKWNKRSAPVYTAIGLVLIWYYIKHKDEIHTIIAKTKTGIMDTRTESDSSMA